MTRMKKNAIKPYRPHKDALLGFWPNTEPKTKLVLVDERYLHFFTRKKLYHELLEDFSYVGPCGRTITVSKGYRCDLTSIPKLFRSFVRREGPHTVAAIIHDAIYDGAYTLSEPLPDTVDEREWGDYILWNGAVKNGTHRAKAYYIWAAVRAGGWVPWAKGAKRRKDNKESKRLP